MEKRRRRRRNVRTHDWQMQNEQSARECHSTNAIDLGHITQSAVLKAARVVSLRRFVIVLVNHRARRIAAVHLSSPVANRAGMWKKADRGGGEEEKTHSLVMSKYVECVHVVYALRDQL